MKHHTPSLPLRYLVKPISEIALARNKMAFISGPRQVGKTTMAKSFKEKTDLFVYKNWDETEFRRTWTKSPNSIKEELDLTRQNTSRLCVFDEIHKSKNWKQKLKGLYDELGDSVGLIVTGSAKLDVFRKGGDSLLGRYYHFRLHPLSYGEVNSMERLAPEKWRERLMKKGRSPGNQATIDRLLRLSGFPEPFFSNDLKILRLWQRGRSEKIVREDLRDLSRILELSQVEMLFSLLPEKVGRPLSVQSLREDLETSFDTVKRWLSYSQMLYYHFEIRPFTKSIKRTLKKEPKIYLYDWTEISDEGFRFENLVANHLKKACDFWSDTGEGAFKLYYLRDKEKNEIDFLIENNGKAWLMVEAKLKPDPLGSKAAKTFQNRLNIPFIQVVYEPDHFFSKNNQGILSATQLFSGLP